MVNGPLWDDAIAEIRKSSLYGYAGRRPLWDDAIAEIKAALKDTGECFSKNSREVPRSYARRYLFNLENVLV